MALVPIQRDVHAKMRLRPLQSFDFAKSTPVVRLLASEIPLAAAAYPIVFIKEGDVFGPYAMLGLTPGENLFVSADGAWQGMYMPALLRRHPFALGKAANGAGANGEVTLMIDDSYLSKDEGELLFAINDKGEPSGPVARALQILGGIELQATETAAIVKSLSLYSLLDEMPLQVTREGGAATSLTGLYTVSDAKLNALPDEAFLQLRKNGALAMAHAQLLSLGQFPRLQVLAAARSRKASPPSG